MGYDEDQSAQAEAEAQGAYAAAEAEAEARAHAEGLASEAEAQHQADMDAEGQAAADMEQQETRDPMNTGDTDEYYLSRAVKSVLESDNEVWVEQILHQLFERGKRVGYTEGMADLFTARAKLEDHVRRMKILIASQRVSDIERKNSKIDPMERAREANVQEILRYLRAHVVHTETQQIGYTEIVAMVNVILPRRPAPAMMNGRTAEMAYIDELTGLTPRDLEEIERRYHKRAETVNGYDRQPSPRQNVPPEYHHMPEGMHPDD